MKISIKCKAADNLPLEELTGLQGDLKTLSTANRDKLKASILKYGFSAPIFIWKNGKKNYLLDGHQRVATLEWMQSEGYEIPPLPVAYVVASSVKEAKEKLLHISSQYGEFDISELNEMLSQIDNELKETVRLCNTEIQMIVPDFEPVGEEDQGNLAELEPKYVICPHCGKEFDVRES